MLEQVTKEIKQNDNDNDNDIHINKRLLEVTDMPAPDLN